VSVLARPGTIERREYVPNSAQDEFIVPLLGERIRRAIATHAAPAPAAGRALDIGCGGQPFRRDLEALGFSYTGLDVQQNPEETVDVICAIDDALPPELLARGRFDFLLCTEVLEHVADWDAAFRNFALLLAPRGRLLVTCPHFYPLHAEPYDYWRPTLHALRHFGTRAGLRTVQQEAAGDAWDVLGTLLATCQPRSTARRWPHRVTRRLVALGARSLSSLLRGRRLQQLVELDSPLYLSNVAVFESP
jgi:SAM-dependent methyltransferase